MLPYDAPLVFGGRPFTGRQVRRQLRWLLGSGDIRPLLRGVYVDSRVPDSTELRATAAGAVIPDDAVVCGQTAAWVHGIDTTALGPSTRPGVHWCRDAADTVEVVGVRLTSPIATTVELAMRLPRPFALSAVDAMLRSGRADRWAVRAATSAYDGQPGIAQARQLLAWADRRAESPGESWLRLRLLDAGFVEPELQVRVTGPDRTYRLDLAYPTPVDGRRLALEYDSDRWHGTARAEKRDQHRRDQLEALGWHVISVRRPDLWGSYPALELTVGAFLCQHPRLPRRW